MNQLVNQARQISYTNHQDRPVLGQFTGLRNSQTPSLVDHRGNVGYHREKSDNHPGDCG